MISIENKSIHIIDIRDKNSYLNGHIDKSMNINYFDLLRNHSKYLNTKDIYYLYCDSGVKSSIVVDRLNKLGYHTVNIVGGYHNYLFKK